MCIFAARNLLLCFLRTEKNKKQNQTFKSVCRSVAVWCYLYRKSLVSTQSLKEKQQCPNANFTFLMNDEWKTINKTKQQHSLTLWNTTGFVECNALIRASWWQTEGNLSSNCCPCETLGWNIKISNTLRFGVGWGGAVDAATLHITHASRTLSHTHTHTQTGINTWQLPSTTTIFDVMHFIS